MHGSLLILFIFRRYFYFLVSGESSSEDEASSPPRRPQQTNYGSSSLPYVYYCTCLFAYSISELKPLTKSFSYDSYYNFVCSSLKSFLASMLFYKSDTFFSFSFAHGFSILFVRELRRPPFSLILLLMLRSAFAISISELILLFGTFF